MNDEQRAENQNSLDRMEQASAVFYRMAQDTKKHQFLEFNGLLAEYIKLLKVLHTEDKDIVESDNLPMKDYNAAYLAEKLDCIYGATFLEKPEIRDAFIAALFDGRFVLVPAEQVRTHDEFVNDMCGRD